MDKKEEFYKKLKESLEKTTTFPTEFLFKFIIPTDDEKLKQVEKIFKNIGADIQTKKSKNGKYTSISIKVNMNSSDDIITKYKEVEAVEGIISL